MQSNVAANRMIPKQNKRDALRDVASPPEENAVELAAEESRLLHRKLQFWRRVALLLGGLAVLILLASWQRSESSRDECADSLAYYAERLSKEKIENLPPELIAALWQSLESTQARRLPGHYRLIIANWSRVPGNESLPLAVCSHVHPTLFGRGRHVLFKTKTGLQVRWLSESEAEPIARESTALDEVL